MERVETLLQQLQRQIIDKSPIEQLLLTAEQLQHELLHLKGTTQQERPQMVSVSMPFQHAAAPSSMAPDSIAPLEAEAKTVEILQVNEAEIEAELEEIRLNAAMMQTFSAQSKPQMIFAPEETEPITDIPTLIHQNLEQPKRELNTQLETTTPSVNEQLKGRDIEWSAKLSDAPVKDLKKAIGINDRFLYINELFRGDEVMYERSIKTINNFSIWPEAEYWIKRELKTKLGWDDSHPVVKQLDQLVRRRFA